MYPQQRHGRSRSEYYLFALLAAVEVLLSFTLFGYIHIPPLSITTAFIPILAAGCLLGLPESTALGLIFGLASMFKASAGYVQGFDQLFSPVHSGMPLQSILLSIGTRTLFGFLTGLAFRAARKARFRRFWHGVIAALAPMVHGILVYGALGLLFPQYTAGLIRASAFSQSDLILALLCIVVVEAACAIWQSRPVRSFCTCIDHSSDTPFLERKFIRPLLFFGLIIMLLTVLSAVYFSQRSVYMLNQYGLTVSPGIAADTLLLHLQFLFAALALNMMSVIVLLIVYKYMSYQNYLGELDALTGIMGRRMFLQRCGQLQTSAAQQGLTEGWFLFLDVDDFKSINDTCGHAAGDRVLSGVANSLSHIFSGCGAIGRVSGDEFAVMVQSPLTEQELARRLDVFLADISALMPGGPKVSCSIGACRFAYPQPLQSLMAASDKLLYQAKHEGKSHYVIAAYSPDLPRKNITSSL